MFAVATQLDAYVSAQAQPMRHGLGEDAGLGSVNVARLGARPASSGLAAGQHRSCDPRARHQTADAEQQKPLAEASLLLV